MKLLLIFASVREGRKGLPVFEWVRDQAAADGRFTLEAVDLLEYQLPYYADTKPGKARNEFGPDEDKLRHQAAEADAIVVVTPEYNHGYPAKLKSAFDAFYHEWNDKPIGFVAYGVVGGARSVEQLRQVAVELRMPPVRNAVHITGLSKRKKFPADLTEYQDALASLYDDLAKWAPALATVRSEAAS